MAFYDTCVDAADCPATGNMVECHEFAGDGFTVCTQKCDANNPCCDQLTCSNGYCTGVIL